MEQRPPKRVTTGLLRGGHYDGMQVEIDEGQHMIRIDPASDLIFTSDPTADHPPAAVYQFRGEITDEGLAVYELAD